MRTTNVARWAALVLVAWAGLGFTVVSGKIVWHFLFEPWKSHYDAAGIPKAFDRRVKPEAELLDRIAWALPESVDVRRNNPGLIADDAQSNVCLKAEADIRVTFVHEGAGYKNAFGYYAFREEAPPPDRLHVEETIVFPNASFSNSGGSSAGLRSGDTLYLGRFQAGTWLGFVVVADGFDTKTGVTTRPSGGPPGGDWVFYTLRGLNPESDHDLKAHTVLLADASSGRVVLGMEDIRRDRSGCDHDFNDIVFIIEADPPDAFCLEGVVPLPDPVDEDRDDDGVKDGEDDFPDDVSRAFVVKSTGTLAFEDRWPAHDDFDYNDLVVGYEVDRVTNASNRLVEVAVHAAIKARGTDVADGLALHIPGVLKGQLKSASLAVNGGAPQAVEVENGHGNAVVFRLVADASKLAPIPSGCNTFNTDPGCPRASFPTIDLLVRFDDGGVDPGTVGLPPFDPFLFRAANRGLEVHLPDHEPTALADASMFNTADDTSDRGKGRWYKSVCEFPWALDLPAEWQWPDEGQSILDAYPEFGEWAESRGTAATDWYLHPAGPGG